MREAKYQETIMLLQENHDHFKKDVDKEVYLKDILMKRAEEYNHLLKKELVLA